MVEEEYNGDIQILNYPQFHFTNIHGGPTLTKVEQLRLQKTESEVQEILNKHKKTYYQKKRGLI